MKLSKDAKRVYAIFEEKNQHSSHIVFTFSEAQRKYGIDRAKFGWILYELKKAGLIKVIDYAPAPTIYKRIGQIKKKVRPEKRFFRVVK
jgi:hypothetical protein